jgi:hypothetical protein
MLQKFKIWSKDIDKTIVKTTCDINNISNTLNLLKLSKYT